jgi:hypothetical protein
MLKRELDDYERYNIHKSIVKELFGDTEEYIKTKIFDSPHMFYVQIHFLIKLHIYTKYFL